MMAHIQTRRMSPTITCRRPVSCSLLLGRVAIVLFRYFIGACFAWLLSWHRDQCRSRRPGIGILEPRGLAQFLLALAFTGLLRSKLIWNAQGIGLIERDWSDASLTPARCPFDFLGRQSAVLLCFNLTSARLKA